MSPAPDSSAAADDSGPACVLVFNSNDPSGAGGLAADIATIASVGAHPLPVVTGAWVRDTAEAFDHFAFDDDAVGEQARTILEDVEVRTIKVGFLGTPENVSTVAEIASDYGDLPLVAHMPDLSWWSEAQIDAYLDAFRQLMLPQTTVLVGNHSTLWRWLLPDWGGERVPGARDIARAAAEHGVPYTLVTGIALPDQRIDNVLASPQSTLESARFERLDAIFTGAGDTLSAALCALIANSADLSAAMQEALSYLDRALDAGFRPGMGHAVPDRMFWAEGEDDQDEDTEPNFNLPPHDTQH